MKSAKALQIVVTCNIKCSNWYPEFDYGLLSWMVWDSYHLTAVMYIKNLQKLIHLFNEYNAAVTAIELLTIHLDVQS